MGVGSRYYIGINRVGRLFDTAAGVCSFPISPYLPSEQCAWTDLDPGNYYLEIWKDEPGGFSPFILRGNGFINIK